MLRDVEVWRIDLASAAAPDAAALAALSDDERARHGAMRLAAPAKAFAVARLALRRLLAQRLGRALADVVLVRGARGKPAVAGASRCFFNVAHTDERVLIALCADAEVGVDVESTAAVAAASGVRALACSPAERAWLAVREAEADAALARLWTRKEAVLKAWGVGLGRPMAMLDLGEPGAACGCVAMAGEPPAAWRDLDAAPGEAAALAVAGAGVTGVRVLERDFSR
ncbi:MAG: 4'-phosphopantetheinyl transferase family protein [Burkholderiaceae bacterium]